MQSCCQFVLHGGMFFTIDDMYKNTVAICGVEEAVPETLAGSMANVQTAATSQCQECVLLSLKEEEEKVVGKNKQASQQK